MKWKYFSSSVDSIEVSILDFESRLLVSCTWCRIVVCRLWIWYKLSFERSTKISSNDRLKSKNVYGYLLYNILMKLLTIWWKISSSRLRSLIYERSVFRMLYSRKQKSLLRVLNMKFYSSDFDFTQSDKIWFACQYRFRDDMFIIRYK